MGTSVAARAVMVVMVVVMVVVRVMVAVVTVGADSGADAALRVYNAIEGENITIRQLPGCCSYCTTPICPKVCEDCKDVVVGSGKEVTLEPRVGPHPLESLHIAIQDDVYCVPKRDLQYLTATALLRVGPGRDCGGPLPFRIASVVVDGSNRFKTCLGLCPADP